MPLGLGQLERAKKRRAKAQAGAHSPSTYPRVVDVVGRNVHLRDHEVVPPLELLSQALVDRLQAVAVPAPRSVELQQHILLCQKPCRVNSGPRGGRGRRV